MPKIEDHIQKAMQEGKFDNLPGKGKPLKLDDNPHEDPEWKLAHHLLKESGFSLPWIELKQEIEAETKTARLALRQAWEWRNQALAEKKWRYQVVDEEWQRAVKAFTERVEKINQRVFEYNLQTPSDKFQMRKLDAQREIESLAGDDR
jgi:DnaJ homolog subfamily C member 28